MLILLYQNYSVSCPRLLPFPHTHRAFGEHWVKATMPRMDFSYLLCSILALSDCLCHRLQWFFMPQEEISWSDRFCFNFIILNNTSVYLVIIFEKKKTWQIEDFLCLESSFPLVYCRSFFPSPPRIHKRLYRKGFSPSEIELCLNVQPPWVWKSGCYIVSTLYLMSELTC